MISPNGFRDPWGSVSFLFYLWVCVLENSFFDHAKGSNLDTLIRSLQHFDDGDLIYIHFHSISSTVETKMDLLSPKKKL